MKLPSIAGETSYTRDIVLKKRNSTIQRVCETHRSYDALQYPLLFCYGEDGYNFMLKQTDPASNCYTNKKISAMDFYAHRLMVRSDSFYHLLRCRNLLHQFMVDMYAKIETERLIYIRLNQRSLRVDNYIHL